MMIETINRLCKDGTIKTLHQAGFISQKLFTYANAYNHFAELIKQEFPFTEAVHKTAERMGITTSTMYRIIQTLHKK